MKALILAGGDIAVTERLRGLCQNVGFVVAADSGVRHAAALGVIPDLIVGDFDSATAADLAPYPNVKRETHPARKDLLDLELALQKATDRGANDLVNDLIIVGALGGRLDQTLAALFIAARLQLQYGVTLHSGHSAAYPLRTGDALKLYLPAGIPFSVLGLEPSQLSLEGASYPLQRAELPFGVGLGISNETTGASLEVTLHKGSALLLLSFV